MDRIIDLSEYMSASIERIIKNAMKAALKNPNETAFLLKYIVSQNIAKKRRDTYEKQGQHIPPFLIGSITSNCNLFCKGCYARANHSCGENLHQNNLSCKRWEKIFKEAKDLGVAFILLAGGEPLLRKDVIEKAATFKDIIFPIFTNGTMLKEEYMKLFDKNRNLVPVLSIEGNEAETDNRRGEGTYKNLIKVMENQNKMGVFYGASVTVTKENIFTVTNNDFIKMLNEKGCKVLFFVEYVPVTASTKELAPTDIERALLEEKQLELRTNFENMIFLSFPGDEKYTGGCLAAGRGFFHINANGNAEPCPFSPYSDTNLKEHTLLQSLQSPLFMELNKGERLLGEHNDGCLLFEKENEVKKLLK